MEEAALGKSAEPFGSTIQALCFFMPPSSVASALAHCSESGPATQGGTDRLRRLTIGGKSAAYDCFEGEELVRGERIPSRMEVRQAVFSKVVTELRPDFCGEGFSTGNKIIEWELNREVKLTAR